MVVPQAGVLTNTIRTQEFDLGFRVSLWSGVTCWRYLYHSLLVCLELCHVL